MKHYLLPLLGLLLGGGLAFWVFALLFTSPANRVLPQGMFPVALAALASFSLAWMAPSKWKLLAASVALPTLLMSVLLLGMLWMEGRSDWTWCLVSGVVLCVCLLSSWLAARSASD